VTDEALPGRPKCEWRPPVETFAHTLQPKLSLARA
jgi:hypothetical protein